MLGQQVHGSHSSRDRYLLIPHQAVRNERVPAESVEPGEFDPFPPSTAGMTNRGVLRPLTLGATT